MKKLLGILVLGLLLSGNAYAEIIKIAGNPSTIFYYYNDSVSKESKYLYTWILGDNIKEPDGISNKSYKAYVQIDCNLKRLKFHQWVYYTKPMGEGDTEIYTPDEINWLSAPPESSWAVLITRICKAHK